MSISLIGSSHAMISIGRALLSAARYDKSVLLLGETGTGKDLCARKIHELSNRALNPFVTINCSNLPDGLFESELFGHTKGAFTGAVQEKAGLLEIAKNGTVFMDEIGELPIHLQAKLLRLLDKKESRRIGATKSEIINARFVFATNRDLHGNVLEGRFRKDLYYRINVVRIRIPPLRERKGDLPELIKHFIDRENHRNGTSKSLAGGAFDKLLAYDFPGNVRELENVIERSFVFSDQNAIRAADVRFDLEPATISTRSDRELLLSTLEQCRWNKTRAALELGMSRRQLYRLLAKYHCSQQARE
jgi:transcriptional regulator with GAF, ATPase, and Fis domain